MIECNNCGLRVDIELGEIEGGRGGIRNFRYDVLPGELEVSFGRTCHFRAACVILNFPSQQMHSGA